MNYKNYFDDLFSLIVFLSCFLIIIVTYFLKRNLKIENESKRNAPGWERLYGFIFDAVICGFLYYIACLSIEKIGIDLKVMLKELLLILIYWLYFAFFESSKYQSTLGKMAGQIIVVDHKGQRISFIKATVRLFLSFISILPFFIGIIIMFLNKYRRTFHDMATNTLVVKK